MSIIKLRRGHIVYLYESVSYWDKEKKQPRSIRKLLGKLDETTGKIVSTAKNPNTGNAVVQPKAPAIAKPSYTPSDTHRNQQPATTNHNIEPSDTYGGGNQASTEAERKAVMPKSTKITGQDSQNAIINTYVNIYSGKAIDVLQEVNKKGMHIVEGIVNFRLSKEGHITIMGDCGDIEVKLFNYDRVNLNVQSRKLLDMLLMKLSEQLPYGEEGIKKATLEVLRITVTLDEFMKMFGLSDKKNARDQFRAAAECMFSIYMTFDYEVFQNTGKRRKRVKKHFSAYLLEATVETRNLDSDPIINSEISFRFGPSLMEYLCTRYIMPIDINIFKINPHKNPHAYNIARHLSEVYRVRMNKGQPPRISVEALLKACPELPTVDEIRENENRKYWEKIHDPVERDLDVIADIYGLIDWHYTHSNGEPLTDSELANYSFEDWLHFMIDFTLPDYPDSTDRIKKYLAGKRKRAAAKKE